MYGDLANVDGDIRLYQISYNHRRISFGIYRLDIYKTLGSSKMDEVKLYSFVEESNRIERIFEVKKDHLDAHRRLLSLDHIKVIDLEEFVYRVQPDAVLRVGVGPEYNVRVGSHIAPPGGPDIKDKLEHILAYCRDDDPHTVHIKYENLHPFTDGNGRSGRALWLWLMMKSGRQNRFMANNYLFLQSFYYQTLSRSDERVKKNG